MGLRGFLLSVLLLAGLGGGPVVAQEKPLVRNAILTIDQDRLFKGSLYGERVAAEIEADTIKLKEELRRIEAELVAEEKALTEKRATMEPDAFRALADAFDEKVQEIRNAQDVKARSLGARMEQERAAYLNLVLPVLGKLMEERGAAIVLDRRTVFAAANGVDITDEALQRIDATLGDGKFQEPAPEE